MTIKNKNLRICSFVEPAGQIGKRKEMENVIDQRISVVEETTLENDDRKGEALHSAIYILGYGRWENLKFTGSGRSPEGRVVAWRWVCRCGCAEDSLEMYTLFSHFIFPLTFCSGIEHRRVLGSMSLHHVVVLLRLLFVLASDMSQVSVVPDHSVIHLSSSSFPELSLCRLLQWIETDGCVSISGFGSHNIGVSHGFEVHCFLGSESWLTELYRADFDVEVLWLVLGKLWKQRRCMKKSWFVTYHNSIFSCNRSSGTQLEPVH